MNFFLWYFTSGMRSMLDIAGGYVRYALHRNNLRGLGGTLFSPWKRDVSFHARGLHPLLFLQVLLNNIIARLLGALVRTIVILWGIGAVLLTMLLVGVITLVTPLAPLVFFGGSIVIGAIFGVIPGATIFVISVVYMIVAFIAWYEKSRVAFDDRREPGRAPWRARMLHRLGIPPQSAPPKTIDEAAEWTAFLTEQRIAPELADAAWTIEREAYDRKTRRERFWSWENLRRASRVGKYWAYAYTSHLDHYTIDLSQADYSQYRDREWIGRAKALEMLVLTLSRPTDNSVFLVGPPGIGKRSLVHALAKQIRENHFRDRVIDEARVLIFDIGQVIADAHAAGRDEKELLRSLFNEAVFAGNVVLVIENINLFLDPGSDLSISDVLNDYLAIPTCRIIGLTTTEAYQALGQATIPALKYFEAITVPEPTKEETITVLLDTFRSLERRRPVFTLRGLHAIVDGAERHNWERPFPERAIDLAQEILLYWEKRPELAYIDRPVVEDFIEEKYGIPMGETSTGEREKLLNLESLLHERIVGQDEAIEQMAEAFRKARAGLGNDKKPIGSFLFLGPTGVGKTETAKALAAVYFGDEERMVRLDMSEFQSPQSVAELIGSPELNLPGRLTTLVREHPYTILLLDELEKVYPSALDVFLQILDEGYVTDGFGRKVNFRNTIVIATSNAGADRIHSATAAGRSMANLKEELMSAIITRGTFKPEFLNRFDGVILFNALTTDEMERVTAMKLQAFADKLYAEKKIRLTFTPGVIQAIVARGYEREYGARSINRFISDVVEDKIVKQLLAGSLAEGAEIVFAEADLSE